MAYLDLDNAFTAPQSARAQSVKGQSGGRVARAAAPAIGFSALEASVIALARGETLGSLTMPGRIARVVNGIFGLRPVSPLADPRLEALRRLAIHAWRRGFALPLGEIDRFLAAGFVEAHIEALVETVTGLRVGGRR